MNICPDCETIFQSDSKFLEHQSKCNGIWPPGKNKKEQDQAKKQSRYRCKHCGTGFDNQAKLDSHVVVCPEDDTKYECDDCGKILKTKRHYENHAKNCNSRETTEDKEDDESSAKFTSVGKKVKKDRRGERISGKSPYSDPELLKDVGLHKGGN